MCRATRNSSQVTILLNNQRVIPFDNLKFIKDYQNEGNKDVHFNKIFLSKIKSIQIKGIPVFMEL